MAIAAEGIAVAGTVIQTLAQLWAQPFVIAILSSLGSWGVAGTLVLLLTGEPSPRRRAVALSVFIIVTGGFYLLMLIGLAAWLSWPPRLLQDLSADETWADGDAGGAATGPPKQAAD